MSQEKDSPTIADWGEFGFIEALRQRLPEASGDLKLGVGDDAAWWTPAENNGILTTTDMLVEGVHFDLSYTSAADLGYIRHAGRQRGNGRACARSLQCPG